MSDVDQFFSSCSSKSVTLQLLALLRVWQGEFAQARPLAGQYLPMFADLGHRAWQAEATLVAAYPKLYLGQYEEALTQARAGADLHRKSGLERDIDLHILGAVALARQWNDEARRWFLQYELVASGNRSKPGQALAMLGYAYRGVGQTCQAKRNLCRGIGDASVAHDYLSLVHALPCIALLYADEGQSERAIALYALAMTQGIVANSKWFEDIAGRHIAEVAASLPPEVAEAARARGGCLDLWQTAEELVEELSERGWDTIRQEQS